jgi:predicted Zn-dependent protease
LHRKAYSLLVAALAATTLTAATSDPLIDAMQAELDRTMQTMGAATPPAYFVSYAVTENASTTLRASFGKLVREESDTRRMLDVDLRVGSHHLDNTHQIRGVAFEMGRGTRGVVLPVGNDAKVLQTMIWRATDKAYRSAAERYDKVVTNLQVKVKDEDTSDDMSHEQALQRLEDQPAFSFDVAQWRENVKRISAIFSEHPELYEGNASVWTKFITKRFVTSEGTVVRTYEPIVQLMVTCMTKADDGMTLPLYRSYAAFSADKLPSVDEVISDAREMIREVLRLRKAPLMETFTGPAILSGRASGVFFHEIFGHRVEGHRQKDVNSSQTFKAFLNKKVLPDFMSVVFDPHLRTMQGRDLVGAYEVDDEGVASQRVVAVENGVFKSFLMGRSPIENFAASNGHGRRQAGYKCVARQSNLMVQASQTVSVERLHEMLREECKKQGKEYGLLFDDIEGGFTFTGRTIPNAFNVLPLVVYKVYADGRPDEMVRGVDLIGTPLTTFNNITAAANDVGIFNGVCGAESGGVPVSASSPSLLVSTIEVQKKQKSQAKPPLLPEPETANVKGASARDRSPLLRAMDDEIRRAMMELHIGDLARPYHIEARLSMQHRINGHAVLGIMEDIDSAAVNTLSVRVRVGGPAFDNTNFFDVSLGFFGSADDEESFSNRIVPLELDYNTLRRELWLALDACFKQSEEIYAKKLAIVKNRTRSDTTWDFSLMPGARVVDTSLARVTYTPAQVATLLEHVSAEFRNAPGIQASRLSMEFNPEEVLYANSEGRTAHKIEVMTGFEIYATTQAPDGMPVSDVYAAYANSPAKLPTEDSLRSAARAVIANIQRQSGAEKMEAYSGPVLFTGQAAAEIVAQQFAPNLVAQRTLLSEGGFSMGGSSTMAFQNKIGARVLPEFLSLKAIPSAEMMIGTPVAGHYTIDDEGMPALDVVVVQNGYLRSLLSSRVPTRRVKSSNGHFRNGGAMYSALHLFTESEPYMLDSQAMKDRMLKLIRDRELDYGIIISSVADRNLQSTGIGPFVAGDMPFSGGQGVASLLQVEKLYPDGHTVPVRGVEAAGFAAATFKDVLAVSQSSTVHNLLAPVVIPPYMTGGPGYSIATIITPDLLFEDVEIRPLDADLPKLPMLTSPMN